MKLDLEDPRLTAYALGELEERERSELDTLIAESPEAREFVEETQETASLLRDELRTESTLHLTEAGRARIEDRLERKPWGGWLVMSRRWGLAASLAAAALIALFVYLSMVPEPARGPDLVRFHDPDGGSGAQPFAGDALALSPDGAHLVFRANDQLYRGEMDTRVAVPIRGTEGAWSDAFFSPDGQWVGFFAGGWLKKVAVGGPLAGAPPLTVCAAESHLGASWGSDDFIVFASDTSSELMRVLASGGTPEPVTTLENGEMRHVWPEVLPGGEAVLFSVDHGNPELSRIAVQSLRTGERRTLMMGSRPHYADFGETELTLTGHIVFMRAGSIWAVPFDRDRLDVTGEAVPVFEEAQVNSGSGLSNFALSRDGSLVYVSPGSAPAERRFVWVDRTDGEESLAAPPRAYEEFTLSPDGTRIAVRIARDLWIYDLTRETATRATFGLAAGRSPLWTPDGQLLAFGGAEGMFWKLADGSGEVEPLVEIFGDLSPQAFSPDGRVLVFQDRRSGWDLSMLSLDRERTPNPLLNTEFFERNAALSPDGRWMAYESDASGQFEIYVRPFPEVNAGRWQASSNGGTWPLWSPDGRELFYVGPQGMVAVAVEDAPRLQFGRPEPLFDTTPYVTSSPTRWERRVAISLDGQRFLMLKGSSTAASPNIVVVRNWFEELKRLVPTE